MSKRLERIEMGNEVGGNEVGGNEVGGNEVGGNDVGGNEVGGNEVGGNEVGGNEVVEVPKSPRLKNCCFDRNTWSDIEGIFVIVVIFIIVYRTVNKYVPKANPTKPQKKFIYRK